MIFAILGDTIGFSSTTDLLAGRGVMCETFRARCKMGCMYKVTDRVYLDFTYEGRRTGSVEVSLLGDTAPMTVANFKGFMRGQSFGGFKDSVVHRLESGYVMQMGDCELGNASGGKRICETSSGRFANENIAIQFSGRGTVSMTYKGPDTNGSQFCIILAYTPQINDKYQVFGFLLGGMETVDFLEKKDALRSARKEIRISHCGFL